METGHTTKVEMWYAIIRTGGKTVAISQQTE